MGNSDDEKVKRRDILAGASVAAAASLLATSSANAQTQPANSSNFNLPKSQNRKTQPTITLNNLPDSTLAADFEATVESIGKSTVSLYSSKPNTNNSLPRIARAS